MAVTPLPRCRQHRTAQVPSDCAACTVRELAVCSSLESIEGENELERHASTLQMQANAVLARAGQPSRHAYTVTSGMLRLSRTLADGRRQVSEFMMPGDFVGLSGATLHRHDIEAVVGSTVCVFEREQIRDLCSRHPELERALFERACDEVDAAHDSMLLLARMSPLERLSSFLLRTRQRGLGRRDGGDGRQVALPMGRSDIADHLGLTVETVSRSFTRLREMALIALPDPHHVDILDVAGLERLARGDG